jgi:hypothetical protein
VDCPCETCWEACPCKILTAITKVSHRSPLPEALQSLKRAALVVDRLFLWVPSSVIEAFAEPKCSTPVAVDHQTDGEAFGLSSTTSNLHKTLRLSIRKPAE